MIVDKKSSNRDDWYEDQSIPKVGFFHEDEGSDVDLPEEFEETRRVLESQLSMSLHADKQRREILTKFNKFTTRINRLVTRQDKNIAALPGLLEDTLDFLQDNQVNTDIVDWLKYMSRQMGNVNEIIDSSTRKATSYDEKNKDLSVKQYSEETRSNHIQEVLLDSILDVLKKRKECCCDGKDKSLLDAFLDKKGKKSRKRKPRVEEDFDGKSTRGRKPESSKSERAERLRERNRRRGRPTSTLDIDVPEIGGERTTRDTSQRERRQRTSSTGGGLPDIPESTRGGGIGSKIKGTIKDFIKNNKGTIKGGLKSAAIFAALGGITSLATGGGAAASKVSKMPSLDDFDNEGKLLDKKPNEASITPVSEKEDSLATTALKAGGSVAGSLAGGAAGGMAGAAIGTMLLPGIGTVAGEFIGEAIGGMVGDELTSSAVEMVTESEIAKGIKQQVSDAVGDKVDVISKKANEITTGIENTLDSVGKDVGDKAAEWTKNITDGVKAIIPDSVQKKVTEDITVAGDKVNEIRDSITGGLAAVGLALATPLAFGDEEEKGLDTKTTPAMLKSAGPQKPEVSDVEKLKRDSEFMDNLRQEGMIEDEEGKLKLNYADLNKLSPESLRILAQHPDIQKKDISYIKQLIDGKQDEIDSKQTQADIIAKSKESGVVQSHFFGKDTLDEQKAAGLTDKELEALAKSEDLSIDSRKKIADIQKARQQQAAIKAQPPRQLENLTAEAASKSVQSVNDLLMQGTQNAIDRGVKYQYGSKNSATGTIDCSGWVMELNKGIYAQMEDPALIKDSMDAMKKGAASGGAAGIIKAVGEVTGKELSGSDVNIQNLKEGMMIGMDYSQGGEKSGEGRYKGIDHITQVVRDPKTGKLQISESSSSKGVHLTDAEEWLKRTQNVQKYAVDPYANLRGVGEGTQMAASRQAAQSAYTGRVGSESVLDTQYQSKPSQSGGGAKGETERGQHVMSRLMEKGWTKEQAAGIVGNLVAESHLNAGVHEGGKASGKGGQGLAQWTGKTKERLEKQFGKKIEDMTEDEQIDMLHWDLTQGAEKGAGSKLKQAQSPEEAAKAFEKHYERSKLAQEGGHQALRSQEATRYASLTPSTSDTNIQMAKADVEKPSLLSKLSPISTAQAGEFPDGKIPAPYSGLQLVDSSQTGNKGGGSMLRTGYTPLSKIGEKNKEAALGGASVVEKAKANEPTVSSTPIVSAGLQPAAESPLTGVTTSTPTAVPMTPTSVGGVASVCPTCGNSGGGKHEASEGSPCPTCGSTGGKTGGEKKDDAANQEKEGGKTSEVKGETEATAQQPQVIQPVSPTSDQGTESAIDTEQAESFKQLQAYQQGKGYSTDLTEQAAFEQYKQYAKNQPSSIGSKPNGISPMVSPTTTNQQGGRPVNPVAETTGSLAGVLRGISGVSQGVSSITGDKSPIGGALSMAGGVLNAITGLGSTEAATEQGNIGGVLQGIGSVGRSVNGLGVDTGGLSQGIGATSSVISGVNTMASSMGQLGQGIPSAIDALSGFTPSGMSDELMAPKMNLINSKNTVENKSATPLGIMPSSYSAITKKPEVSGRSPAANDQFGNMLTNQGQTHQNTLSQDDIGLLLLNAGMLT